MTEPIEPLSKLFPRLVKRIEQEAAAHALKNRAHDFIHDLTVAGYCRLIAPNETIARMAVASALCHSTDRRFPTDNSESLVARLRQHLEHGTDYRSQTMADIIQAILLHSRPNENSDSVILMVLKDADRLANLGLPASIRGGQHYHALPTFDPRFVTRPDPAATYKEPRTVLHDIRSALEWDPREGKQQFCLRLPKAIELGTPYFDWLKLGLQLAERQLVETGVRELFS